MGDFGRQISQKYENSINLLQFSLLQHAWSELEVLVFLKRMVFTEQKRVNFWILKIDLTEKIRQNLTLCESILPHFGNYGIYCHGFSQNIRQINVILYYELI